MKMEKKKKKEKNEEIDLWKRVCKRDVGDKEVYIYETSDRKVIENFFLRDKSVLELMKEDPEEGFSLTIFVYPRNKVVKYYLDICYSLTSLLEIKDVDFKKLGLGKYGRYERILRWLSRREKVKK